MAKAKHEQPILAREGDELVERNPRSQSSQVEHDHHSKVKHGQQRLDKRSAQGVNGQPKKSGQGGKFTWGGPLDDAALDESPAALDKNDPNYVDEDEVAVAKSDTTPQQKA